MEPIKRQRRVLQHDILILQKELTIIPPCELVTVHILDAAIYFHCLPSMLKRVQECIPFLTEESIKKRSEILIQISIGVYVNQIWNDVKKRNNRGKNGFNPSAQAIANI